MINSLPQFLVMSVIILFLLWGVSFLILWIAMSRLARMIYTIEECIDLLLLRSEEKEDLSNEERATIRARIKNIKEKVCKDFEV